MWKQFPIVIDNAPFYYYPDVKQNILLIETRT
jgi:hypothetical protein